MYLTLKKMARSFPFIPLPASVCKTIFIKNNVEIKGKEIEIDRSNSTKFAFNLGGGITLPLSEHSYLNAEAKFMFAKDDNVVIMLGYGYKF